MSIIGPPTQGSVLYSSIILTLIINQLTKSFSSPSARRPTYYKPAGFVNFSFSHGDIKGVWVLAVCAHVYVCLFEIRHGQNYSSKYITGLAVIFNGN